MARAAAPPAFEALPSTPGTASRMTIDAGATLRSDPAPGVYLCQQLRGDRLDGNLASDVGLDVG